ncbi:hypothetical protein CYY_008658 [Polysphondylium violaceum]|uniref:Uncharacterized protein n=1 Tax=Polysphondylium violaceum TaxID=133409 RepID=A0A8J4PN56_9MYCE|nr:hypothetical protein CYY_008658 [Polysphondylium violaceum]
MVRTKRPNNKLSTLLPQADDGLDSINQPRRPLTEAEKELNDQLNQPLSPDMEESETGVREKVTSYENMILKRLPTRNEDKDKVGDGMIKDLASKRYKPYGQRRNDDTAAVDPLSGLGVVPKKRIRPTSQMQPQPIISFSSTPVKSQISPIMTNQYQFGTMSQSSSISTRGPPINAVGFGSSTLQQTMLSSAKPGPQQTTMMSSLRTLGSPIPPQPSSMSVTTMSSMGFDPYSIQQPLSQTTMPSLTNQSSPFPQQTMSSLLQPSSISVPGPTPMSSMGFDPYIIQQPLSQTTMPSLTNQSSPFPQQTMLSSTQPPLGSFSLQPQISLNPMGANQLLSFNPSNAQMKPTPDTPLRFSSIPSSNTQQPKGRPIPPASLRFSSIPSSSIQQPRGAVALTPSAQLKSEEEEENEGEEEEEEEEYNREVADEESGDECEEFENEEDADFGAQDSLFNNSQKIPQQTIMSSVMSPFQGSSISQHPMMLSMKPPSSMSVTTMSSMGFDPYSIQQPLSQTTMSSLTNQSSPFPQQTMSSLLQPSSISVPGPTPMSSMGFDSSTLQQTKLSSAKPGPQQTTMMSSLRTLGSPIPPQPSSMSVTTMSSMGFDPYSIQQPLSQTTIPSLSNQSSPFPQQTMSSLMQQSSPFPQQTMSSSLNSFSLQPQILANSMGANQLHSFNPMKPTPDTPLRFSSIPSSNIQQPRGAVALTPSAQLKSGEEEKEKEDDLPDLPPPSTTSEKSQAEGLDFMSEVRQRFCYEPETFERFESTLHGFFHGPKTIKQVYHEVSQIFGSKNSDLSARFREFLPDN